MLGPIGFRPYQELKDIHHDSIWDLAHSDLNLSTALEKAQVGELDMRACWKAEDSNLSLLDKVSRFVGGGKSKWSAEKEFNSCYEAFCEKLSSPAVDSDIILKRTNESGVFEAERMMQKIVDRYPAGKDPSKEGFFNYSEGLSCLNNVGMEQYKGKLGEQRTCKDSIDLKVDTLAGTLVNKQIATGKLTLSILAVGSVVGVGAVAYKAFYRG